MGSLKISAAKLRQPKSRDVTAVLGTPPTDVTRDPMALRVSNRPTTLLLRKLRGTCTWDQPPSGFASAGPHQSRESEVAAKQKCNRQVASRANK